jgi:hypothetical protein
MDPEPNPVPHVSGPPESRYVSHRSGSFYDQAKIIRENLDFYCFVTSLILYDFLSLKTDIMYLQQKAKNLQKKNIFFVDKFKTTDEKSRIRIRRRIRTRNSIVRIRGSGSVPYKISRIHNNA